MNDKRITTGPNFDLIVDVDLTDKLEQDAFWRYRRKRKTQALHHGANVQIFRGWSRMNRITNLSTWQRNHDTVDKPLAKFAGEVAQEQLADNIDFVNELPVGSNLYDV